ncbi:Uncharacterized protein FWK35_00036951 [Aphis craccivora]|uniref:Uncharacterized protein n=1 Tax=Aphis craccivora TaxID=307492 RepID=A0A6G0YS70_APHCR|nr:Uncharacterized protein FWK35_00036951 [Aphis craccivora]
MHKWLQLPANPTDDPLATVYPINHYKKSHVYAVTRINPIYVDDEIVHHDNNETWKNKSGSSGYDSQPHSDHSSLDKGSPPATKCLRNGTTPPSSDGSSGSPVQRTAPWLLSPIKEGVIDVHQYCIPRPVWPGYADGGAHHGYPADLERIPRVKCCRHCARCRCRSNSTSSSSTSSTNSGGGGNIAGGGCSSGSFSGYSSAFGGGTISTGSTSTTSSGGGGDAGMCLDDVNPSPAGNGPVVSNQSPLTLDPRFSDGVGINKVLVDNWNSVDLRLNQKTDNLHYFY